MIDERNMLVLKHNYTKKVKTILIGIGFDYALLGTFYLQEIIVSVLLEPQKIHYISSKVMTDNLSLEDVSVKCIDKDIRWAIKKAYKAGILSKMHFFEDHIPTIKQLVNWIFDFHVAFDKFFYKKTKHLSYNPFYHKGKNKATSDNIYYQKLSYLLLCNKTL